MSAFRRDDGGQSVVLIAVSLPLILALLMLVIDGGRLYVERERIRNAAQLAAEAAVSLAADKPGGPQPKDAEVRGIVAEALSRNLPGEGYVADVVIPFRTDITTFNVKVSVRRPFRSSIGAITFTIGADGAAKLGDAGQPAARQPEARSGAGEAGAPASPGEICGRASVADGSIIVPGEIGRLTGPRRYSAAGSTERAGARCQADLYLADGGAVATYTIDVTAAGDRDLWIRAHDDGRHPAGTRSVTIAIDGQVTRWANEGRDVGWKWYPVGRFRLGEGRTEVRITKVAQTSAAFVMDEFVLASDPGSVPR